MAEVSERNYHVGYARAGFDSLDDDLPRAISESWKPGASIGRFRRRWHLSKIVDQREDLYFGRIGFVSDTELSTLTFDQKTQDFVYGEAPSGYVVPFVIRSTDGVIAYQLYPGVVRETTFTGALQDLLNSASQEFVWRIQSFVEERPFDEWLASIERVVKFDFSLDKPNPNYVGRPRIEEMVEGTHVAVMRIIGRAGEGEAVDVNSDVFQEAVDHVIEHQYGKAKITGLDGQGGESTWLKRRGGTGRVASQRTIAGEGTEEAPEAVLLDALASSPAADAPTEQRVDAEDS